MITNFLNLSRPFKKVIMVSLDSILLILVAYLSFALRLGEIYLFKFLNPAEIYFLLFSIPFIAFPIFLILGIYSSTIRYMGFRALWVIIKAVSLYALVGGVLLLFFQIENFPRSVIIINWFSAVLAITGIRMTVKWLIITIESNKNINKKNVLIYGAGSAGRQLLNALSHSDEYCPVGLLDDSTEIQNQTINGLEVFSPNSLDKIIKNNNILEIFIAMPELSRSQRKSILKFLSGFSVLVKSLPSLSQLAEGNVKIDDLQVVNIKDLLGRNLIEPNISLLKINITNKIVLVTGAGGSIGSELCRQIILIKPKILILFEQNEFALYKLEMELIDSTSKVKIIPLLGSVGDFSRLNNIFNHFKIETIYHAAAYKHVPLVEFNQSEGVLNNIFGTLTLVKAAIRSKVKTFVLISTDKAVRPTNTMGATKRIAELIVQGFAKQTKGTCFTMVRFGNVLDSSGSVIPLFKKQIKNGGPVTVTDKNIVRYFMTISEAVELVIQAGAMAKGGDLFVLDMGEPIKINELALKMIRLSGLKLLDKNNPNGDIEIIYSGLRPGEKLYEELLTSENTFETSHPLIMRAEEEMMEWKKLEPLLNELKSASHDFEQLKIRALLMKIVPEFKPQSPVVDLLFGERSL